MGGWELTGRFWLCRDVVHALVSPAVAAAAAHCAPAFSVTLPFLTDAARKTLVRPPPLSLTPPLTTQQLLLHRSALHPLRHLLLLAAISPRYAPRRPLVRRYLHLLTCPQCLALLQHLQTRPNRHSCRRPLLV